MKKKTVKPSRWPWAVIGLFALYLLMSFGKPTHSTSMDIERVGAFPVLNGGRIKPLDTVARVSLLVIHGKQTIKTEDKQISAIEWFLDVLFRPQQANRMRSFRIDDPEVLGVLRIEQRSPPDYSFNEMAPSLDQIERQSGQAEQIKPESRTAFQKAIVQLQNKLFLYTRLQNTLQPAGMDHVFDFITNVPKDGEAHHHEHFHLMNNVAEFFPVIEGEESPQKTEWISMGQSLLNQSNGQEFNPGVLAIARLGDAYRQFDPVAFNNVVAQQQEWLLNKAPKAVALAKNEVLFNRVQPFMKSLVIYLVAALFIFISWLRRSENWVRAAAGLIVLALTIHTVGLMTRMVLQGRPPVTNLYSSAIFIGWASVILGLVLEKIHRNSVGLLVSSTMGFLTMIIAHNLASTGDTMEMMRAVLDTNFWLATHVVCVTIGYSSTFLSGFLAIIAILRKTLQKDWPESEQQALETMVFGVVCFSTFFSFLGTILGGIWADQSWGRFWGWDPKENGALLIVLWNAFILHARKLGYARGIRLMNLAIIGNIFTAFSWFGVNMLGIGLHSYGFMEAAFVWLLVFIFSQLVIIGLGLFLEGKEELR